MSDYPQDLLVRPLTTWPGALTRERVRSTFSASLRQTLTLLDRELWQLQSKAPIMEVAIEPQQFRIDGRPRAAAKATHPGVVLSLPQTSVGPLRYSCDRFLTWQDNLRAIALGLEALRKVERYGITRRGEQYAGFRALPPGGAEAPAGPLSEAQALAFLAEHSDRAVDIQTDQPGIELAYRAAVKALHPDRGGDPALFHRLQESMALLRGPR